MGEGIAVSVVVLAVGSFTVIGASAMAPLISEALGLTEVGIGAIASVAYLGALLTAPLAGRVTDRSGPARVIILGLLALALGNLLAGLAWHALVLYVGILVAGFGYGAVNPATTVLSNPATARRRALVMSVKQAGVPAGGIVAGAVLPVLGVAFGWRWAFALSMLVCLVVALLVSLRGGYVAQRTQRSSRTHTTGRHLRLPLGYVFGMVIAGVQVSIFAFTAVYLVDARGFSASGAGLGVSTLLIGGVFGRLFWGWLSDLFPHHRLRVLEGIGILGAVSSRRPARCARRAVAAGAGLLGGVLRRLEWRLHRRRRRVHQARECRSIDGRLAGNDQCGGDRVPNRPRRTAELDVQLECGAPCVGWIEPDRDAHRMVRK